MVHSRFTSSQAILGRSETTELNLLSVLHSCCCPATAYCWMVYKGLGLQTYAVIVTAAAAANAAAEAASGRVGRGGWGMAELGVADTVFAAGSLGSLPGQALPCVYCVNKVQVYTHSIRHVSHTFSKPGTKI